MAFFALLATFIYLWRCTTKGVASCGKLSINAPNPSRSNYTKRRFFAVLVSENTGKTLLRTYKKSLFGAFGASERVNERGKGWRGGEGAPPEYLNT